MTELEFDILDEMYFIISFDQLLKTVSCSEAELKEVLQKLLNKGWIKLAEPIESQTVPPVQFNISANPHRYHYLITKEGLLAHN